MSTGKFFLLSVVLAIVAIGLQLASLSQTSHGVQLRAKVNQSTLEEPEKASGRRDASQYSSRGRALAMAGFPFALASVAGVVMSARKHEPASRALTAVLLAFYLMLGLMLI